MAGICWLHLSDWHQKGPDFDRKVVRDKLIADIRNRAKIDSRLEQIDFIVFSGDVAFSGQESEYKAAKEHLFSHVLEATNLKSTPDHLFIVPGNHDLNRDRVYAMLPTDLHKPFESDEQVQKYLMDEEWRELLLKPFKAFGRFVGEYTRQLPADYANIRRWTIGDKQVALLGLNSAWMCGRKDEKGQVNDDGSVLVGEPQIFEALKEIEDADIKIAVLHHPLDWLNRFERKPIERWLKSNFHFILHGHAHEPDVQRAQDTSGDYVIIPAGAVYDRRKTEELRYINAYNLVCLEGSQGVVYLRQWHDVRNEWLPHQIYPDGAFRFSLPKGLGQEPQSTSSPAAVAAAPAESHTDAQRLKYIEDCYRQLMLRTCDIVNLANLPEQDRNLAQRQLELRRLYVPLRVWVEASAGQQDDKQLWEALEKRRAAAQHGRAEAIEAIRERIKRQRAPVGERLASARRLLILGDPGAGKTTLTRWIATAYLLRLKNDPDWQELPDVKTLPDQDWLPIIVRCRDLDPNCLNGSLDDILHHTLRKAELSEADTLTLRWILRERLKDGKALLMLDGLDEITDPTARACFCQQLEAIVLAYPNAAILATSRIVGYREMGYRLGRGFEHVTLADLEYGEKNDFARRWCELTELPERRADAIRELIHDIHSTDRIERMTGNPMLLTTMALVKRKVGKLPNRRADLYYEAVQVLLNWRSERDEPLDWLEAIPQLEYIAYAMCDRGVQQLRQDEVLELITQMRSEYPNIHRVRNHTPEEFLHRLEARTGLLVEVGRTHDLGIDVPVYEFRHLTFQEYLAARALVDGCLPVRDPNRRLAEHVAPLAGRTIETAFTERGPQELVVMESWQEALRLCTVICRHHDVDSVLLAVLKPQEGEPLANTRARAVLAALCLADEPNASDEVAGQVLQAFAEQVAKSDGEGRIRTSADSAAMELASTRWARDLCTNLANEFRRREAPNRRYPGGLAAMVDVAMAPQDAAELDSWLAERVQQIQTGNEPIATNAALSIMELAYEDKAHLVPGLVDGLLTRLHGNTPMAHAASWALRWLNNRGDAGKLWQPQADDIEYFLATVSNSTSDPGIVRNIILILGEESIRRAVEPIIVWLNGSDAEVRRAAADALGDIGSERAVEPLIARLDDSEAEVRGMAADALGNIGSERAVEPLIARLDDSEAKVRRAAADALGNIGSERAVEPLIVRLGDSEANVRNAAADALGDIGSERAVEPLIVRLGDSEANVRNAAATALGRLKNEHAVELLLARLDASEAQVRRAAADALGNIGSERAVEQLIARLDDSEVRIAAAGALGNIGSERAVEPLLFQLGALEVDVRSVATLALGNLKDERALEPLIARLADPEAVVRTMAALALGILKDERAVESLNAQLADSEAQVRNMVAFALGSLEDERAVEPLLARLADSEAEMRSAAARALGNLKNERAVEPLLARLDDSKAQVRSAAADALGILKNERAVEPLLARLDDSKAQVRAITARVLGQIGSERAVEPLLTQLNALEVEVRSAAARALGNIGSERAVEPLLVQLCALEVEVRSTVADALGSIGSERAVEPLIARLEDSEAWVRRVAAYALGKIGSERAVEPLIQRLNDSEAQVRRQAADALGSIGNERVVGPLIARLEDGEAQVRSEAAYSLGMVYRVLGRDAEAIDAFQQVIKIDPKYFTAYTSLAACYYKLGREAESAKCIRIARRMIANIDTYNRACFESICGNVDKALDLLKTALEKKEVSPAWARRDPDFDFIRDDPRFGELLQQKNRTQVALP